SRNSWICYWFKCSAFCIVNCIPPKHAATPSFMLMLHWNQLRFYAHLALDNSQPGLLGLVCYIGGNRSPKRNEPRDCRREVSTTGRDHGPLTRPGRLPVGSRTDLRQHQAIHPRRNL